MAITEDKQEELGAEVLDRGGGRCRPVQPGADLERACLAPPRALPRPPQGWQAAAFPNLDEESCVGARGL
ncbi:hypothetical protein E2562_013456 [Oryza meyeriana var. granulata]|uniref:Uncharacterized protein n=1 Tax=Oryza meyeriana var. granulata TaxID=110450 RepID=A0A6G1BVP8_9ORYZ|nr:hypothetical protein E2562_013456 [Oryza meyeriana var. granulata]